MPKLKFKRKKKGGKDNWGAGWDYMLKDFYNDLDHIIKDNYFRRYNTKLINKAFKNLFQILNSEAIPKMEELKRQEQSKLEKESCQEWLNGAEQLNKFFKKAKKLSDKVIAIDNLVQFLRSTQERPLDLEEIQIVPRKKAKKLKEIKGTIANKGLASGRVKIIIETKDLKKVRKGDILVADETDPDFLPAMQKARAIVTDLGGVLCHAAIVSRELKIPCITGTKIATQIFKDEDLVEVDAEKGVVKIIKKAK